MSKREPKLLVSDILESAHKILTYTEGQSFDDFTKDSKTVDAVIRNFEIIGEAANRLPEDFKAHFSEIDWHRIRGFRNRIVHDYFGIDYSIVWTIKETFLSLMIAQLQPLSETWPSAHNMRICVSVAEGQMLDFTILFDCCTLVWLKRINIRTASNTSNVVHQFKFPSRLLYGSFVSFHF